MLIAEAPLRDFVREIFIQAGSARSEADEIAEHLVEANLRGHDSHGVGMVPAYIKHLAEKAVVPNNKPQLVMDLGALMVFDAGMGYGQPAANAAMDAAGDRAAELGSAVVCLRNVQHVGRVGAYGERLARRGLLSIHFVNAVYAQACVAPFRGSDARLMTNPICVTIPRGGDAPPVVLDFATSAIALGKVRVALNKGVETPENTLIDHKGQPTRAPQAIFSDPRGAIVPFGLHKGWGLSLVAEILGGALAGGGTQAGDRRPGLVNGMFSIVVDQTRLTRGAQFFDEVTELVDYVKASPAARPDEPVLVPGDPELMTMAERRANGVPIDETTWREILGAAKSVGLAPPAF